MLKKAFSVAEAIILVTVLAVALAATIPHLSKRVINNAQEGSSIGGASHGRYEIYRDDNGALVANLYSGTHKVYENKVVGTGEAIDFVPPADAQNIMIYAVGAGGAGGGLNGDYGEAKAPTGNKNNAIDAAMIEEFRKRFDVAVSNNKYIGSTVPKFDGFVETNSDGTVTVKADINLAVILYHDLFNYTSVLGAQHQPSTTHPMPKWFSWDAFASEPPATVVACGGAGGSGSSFHWDTNKDGGDDICCMKDAFGCDKTVDKIISEITPDPYYYYYNAETSVVSGSVSSCSNGVGGCCSASCSDWEEECTKSCSTDDDGKETCKTTCVDKCVQSTLSYYTSTGYCKPKKYVAERHCEYSGTAYYDTQPDPAECNPKGYYKANPGCGGSCSAPRDATCPTFKCTPTPAFDSCGVSCARNDAICPHDYSGSGGGGAPDCVVVQFKVNKAVDIKYSCSADATDAPDCSAGLQPLGTAFPACDGYGYGAQGKSCIAIIGSVAGKSIGGEGGCPFIQQMQSISVSMINKADASPELVEKVAAAINATAARVDDSYESATIGKADTSISFLATTDAIEEYLEAVEDVADYVAVSVAKTDCLDSGYFMLSSSFMCMALTSTGQSCSPADGKVECPEDVDGKITGPGDYACYGTPNPPAPQGRYNYDYEWTAPYMTNQLGYGESGSVGEFKEVKISKVEKGSALRITIGRGGKWARNAWHSGNVGPKGGNTTVKIGDKLILNAEGGEGGAGGFLSNNYDFCFANDKNKTCADGEPCCSSKGIDTTGILVSRPKESEFDKRISAVVQGSKLIGRDLGNSGYGGGAKAENSYVYGTRTVKNLHPLPGQAEKVVKFTEAASGSNIGKKNVPNSELDALINGKPGAVVITW